MSAKLTPTMQAALIGAARGREPGNLACAEVRRDTRNALVDRGLVEAWQAGHTSKPYVESRLTEAGWRAAVELDSTITVPPVGERWGDR